MHCWKGFLKNRHLNCMQFAGKYIKIVIKKLPNCWEKAAKFLENQLNCWEMLANCRNRYLHTVRKCLHIGTGVSVYKRKPKNDPFLL